MNQTLRSIVRVKYCLTLVLMVLVFGCGIKAPPMAPITDGNIITPATNLAYALEDRQVTLTWEHKPDAETAKLTPEGFEIFVATKDPNGCEGCPFIFQSAGIVSMPKKSFQYTLKDNLHHYFRIQALGKNDVKSKYSTPIYIDVQ